MWLLGSLLLAPFEQALQSWAHPPIGVGECQPISYGRRYSHIEVDVRLQGRRPGLGEQGCMGMEYMCD